MLTSWHFDADGDIWGQKHVFFLTKNAANCIILQNSRDPSKVVTSRGSYWNIF